MKNTAIFIAFLGLSGCTSTAQKYYQLGLSDGMEMQLNLEQRYPERFTRKNINKHSEKSMKDSACPNDIQLVVR